MSEAQTASILHHLRKKGPITPLEALREYGCFRLGARIWDLKKEGHQITREMVESNGKRFARYELQETA